MRNILLFFLSFVFGYVLTTAIRHKLEVHNTVAVQQTGHFDQNDDIHHQITISSDRGVDGYTVDQAEFMHTDIDLRVHMYRSRQSFDAAAKMMGVTVVPGGRVMGFTISEKEDKYCDMYIFDPAFYYGPEYIGHELVHCIYGQFHPDQNIGKQ